MGFQVISQMAQTPAVQQILTQLMPPPSASEPGRAGEQALNSMLSNLLQSFGAEPHPTPHQGAPQPSPPPMYNAANTAPSDVAGDPEVVGQQSSADAPTQQSP